MKEEVDSEREVWIADTQDVLQMEKWRWREEKESETEKEKYERRKTQDNS